MKTLSAIFVWAYREQCVHLTYVPQNTVADTAALKNFGSNDIIGLLFSFGQ